MEFPFRGFSKGNQISKMKFFVGYSCVLFRGLLSVHLLLQSILVFVWDRGARCMIRSWFAINMSPVSRSDLTAGWVASFNQAILRIIVSLARLTGSVEFSRDAFLGWRDWVVSLIAVFLIFGFILSVHL